MERRRFLATVAAGMTIPLTAGCLGDGRDTTTTVEPSPRPAVDAGADGGTTRAAGTGTTGTGGSPTGGGQSADISAIMDADLPVSDDELTRGAPKDGIPAITGPVFGPDWSENRWTLEDSDRVIGVTDGDDARAYPLAILNWHEVVNDAFGSPLLVTFCPLCGSGVVAERTVDGEPTLFGVSGYLWHADLVMYDRKTNSLWSQLLAKAIQGPKTGTSLTLVPSTLATWGEWQEAHPETEVLLPPPESNTVRGEVDRHYNTDPYASYAGSSRIGITGGSADDRLHPKAKVIGVTHDGTARAYPLDAVRNAGGVVNDAVAGLPVVVAATEDGSLVAYERTVDGTTHTFGCEGGALVGGGSRWELLTGEAVDGPLEGTTLTVANDRSPMFWFAWADFHPETELYGEAG